MTPSQALDQIRAVIDAQGRKPSVFVVMEIIQILHHYERHRVTEAR